MAAYFQTSGGRRLSNTTIISSGKAKSGASVQMIAEELGADVFERTGQLSLDFFHKNCAVLVKNSLRHEGIECEA